MVGKDEDEQSLGDADLVAAARSGDEKAFAELWKRHARAGRAAARQFSSIADADDLVSEAYLRILRAVQQGGGPREGFRPYLYRTIRNIALDWRAKVPAISLEVTPEIEDPDDPHAAALENTITVRAFRTLPERWQAVLWYLDVEGMAPAETSVLLGLSPNATSALAIRARAGFKDAWLQAHVNGNPVPEGCVWTTERMGQYARGTLTRRARDRFDNHLTGCERCTALVEELDQLGGRLAALLLPLTLGGAAGSGLLAEFLAAPGRAAAAPRARAPHSAARVTLVAGAAALAVVALGTGAWAASSAWRAETVSTATENPEESSTPDTPAATPETAPPSPAPSSPAQPTPAPPTPAPPAGRWPVVPSTPAVPVAPVIPVDTSAPAPPQLVAPADGMLTNDPRPTLSGTGEPGARVLVELVDQATATPIAVGTAIVGPDGSWSLVPQSAIPDGDQVLEFSQADSAGNRSDIVTRALTVDTIALVPQFDALPSEAQLFLPEITGIGEPLATVTLRDDTGTTLGTAEVGTDGRWMLLLPDHGREQLTLAARQVDRAGNTSSWSGDSAAIIFDRPTIPSPALGEVIPSQGGATVVEIQLAGHSGMYVQVFINGSSTGNTHALQSTPIARVTPPLPDGAHTVGVRYVDPTTGRVGSTFSTSFTIG